MILISLYHAPNGSNYDHLNHSYSRTLEKKSNCYDGMLVSVCVRALHLLAFPKTKIIFEREEISDL